MKVISIDDEDSLGCRSHLYTKGRWYEVVSSPSDLDQHMIYIRSDNGTNPAVLRSKFLTGEEWRDNKLNELGI
jgi:hypothetical protein